MSNSRSKSDSDSLSAALSGGGQEGFNLLERPEASTQAPAIDGLNALAGAVAHPDQVKRRSPRFPWWLPAMSDLFVLAFFTWSYLGGANGWLGLLVDADSGWHIRTGEFILHTHSVPKTDLFSFSKPAADWFAWEWLTDVLWAKLYGWMGLRGVVWFSGILITSFAAILLRFSLWLGSSLFISIAMVLMGCGAASTHYLARPHVFTLILLPLCVWLIEADRRNPSRRLYWIIPVVGIWANLHGGFPAALLVLSAATVGSAVEAFLARAGNPQGRVDWRIAARYAAVTAASALASVVNPYGIRLHQHMFEYLRSDWIQNVIEEFHSPNFRGESMLQFEFLLFTGLLVASSLIRQKRIVHALWIIGFGHMALSSVRHVTLFAAVVTPYLSLEVSAWWRMASQRAKHDSLAGIWRRIDSDLFPSFARTSFWLPLLLVGSVFLPASVAHWPDDYPKERFPTAIIARHRSELAEARVLTTDQWGDYLIFRNYPTQKVFVDGRSDFFGPEIGNEYIQLLQGQPEWRKLMQKYGFDLVLAPVGWPLTSLLQADTHWRVLENDGKAVLFQRVSRNGTS